MSLVENDFLAHEHKCFLSKLQSGMNNKHIYYHYNGRNKYKERKKQIVTVLNEFSIQFQE